MTETTLRSKVTPRVSDDVRRLSRILDGELDEEIIEIDENGHIRPMRDSRSRPQSKTVVLHDPHGDYGRLR